MAVHYDLFHCIIILFAVCVCCLVTGTISADSAGSASEAERIVTITPDQRASVIDTVNGLLIKEYIFLEVAEKVRDSLTSKLKSGGYDLFTTPTEFAVALWQDLREFSQDSHFFIEYNPERAGLVRGSESADPEEVAAAERRMMEQERLINFGFNKVERLQGNVGYLDIRFLCNPAYAGETAAAAMAFLANMDAVIIDLRDTPGGWPTMVQLLCSYFVSGEREGRTHLNSFYRRAEDRYEQFWTIPYVPGKRMFDKDLYILTNRGTGSGAEELAYNMKNLKRGTLVGETTHGSAHPVETRIVEDVYVMHMPTGRPINPISGTNWEQTGIEPDVAVPSAEALEKAWNMALEKLEKNCQNPDQLYQISWARIGLQAKSKPPTPDLKVLQSYTGSYGRHVIEMKDAALSYRRADESLKLVPLTERLFQPEGMSSLRLEFIVDEGGVVTGLVRHFEDGYSDRASKTN